MSEEGFIATLLGAYVVGAPIAMGVMMAKGAGAASLIMSIIWPIVALAWIGFWVAS